MPGDEEPLFGGNVSGGVVRVGDTVRRPTGPWTPAVHALLRHLHEVDFAGAPRPLGIDEQGREVLTYAPGTVPWDERFHLLAPTERLVRVARLIREFHDAVTGFTPPPDARWRVLIPSVGEPEIIAHHDLAPWNLVAGEQWVFIDYGLAEAERRALVPLLAQRTRAVYDFLADQAARGNEPWLIHWRSGHGDAWRSNTDYIAAQEPCWASALEVG